MQPDLPSISVIIPHRNAAEMLSLALAAFQNQEYPAGKIEIIVVDNGSETDIRSITTQYHARLIEVPAPHNPYVCRNIGIQHASHAWILLSDAVCIPDTLYLRALVNAQSDRKADLVVGNVQFDVSPSSTLGEIVDSLHFMRNAEYTQERTGYPGCSLYFHKSLPEKVGMFREDMRSGADFCWTRKVHEAAAQVVYAEKALVHRKGVEFPRLLRKAHRLGWGHGTMARENRTYSVNDTIWRMRPPGRRYLNDVLRIRGQGAFDAQRLRIWFGLWMFRIAYNVGRLHICRSTSD